ncbi:hypothetical protein, partial [Burkholderia anthina]|uniref:hypothetical protein n=1 Tax=Burkholderia anthina TaxID=179879 RepID=UPI00384BEC9C
LLARPVSRVVFNRQSATDASTEWVKVNTDGHGLQPHLWVILRPLGEGGRQEQAGKQGSDRHERIEGYRRRDRQALAAEGASVVVNYASSKACC